MIYEIADGRVHLVSSIHVMPSGAVIPESYWDLHRLADRVVFETDLEGMHMIDWGRVGSLDARNTLKELIPSDLYRSASDRWKEFGIPGRIGRLRPWCAALTLEHALMERNGFTTSRGVDQQLWEVTDPSRRRWLESAEDGLTPIAQAPRAEQLQMLRVIAATPEIALHRVRELYRGWQQADEAVSIEAREYMLKETPSHVTGLEGRNFAWAPNISDYVSQGGRTLVVMGELHFVGENSVPRLLERAGTSVIRVA